MFSFWNRSNIRILLFAFIALLITAGSLIYSNHIARQLLGQEEQRIARYATSLSYLGNESPDPGECDAIIASTITENKTIPVIQVNSEGGIDHAINLGIPEDIDPEERKKQEKEYLDDLIQRGYPEPIEIEFLGSKQYIYYDESPMLKRLRYYPYLQLLVILLFFVIVFVSFFVAQRSEQNKVWVGLAKETAHQLGTPVSSLMAWIELLKMRAEDNPKDLELISELEKDVHRLTMVAERFSKIGSKPELEPISLSEFVDRAADYVRKRMSARVDLQVKNEAEPMAKIRVNPALFEWVVENLLKNALDAIPGEGFIHIHVRDRGREYWIDVQDSGKGIPRNQFKQVFRPGFTTKKRGWGLGLSLTRRIVENYHKGRIFIKHSEVGKGTTFRVVIPK